MVLAYGKMMAPLPGLSKGMPIESVRTDWTMHQLPQRGRAGLALVHGTPRLGNKDDAVDELVYIILARKTREDCISADV